MTFKIGDKVKFKKVKNDYVPKYSTDIPAEYIIHGSTMLDMGYYKENYAEIVHITLDCYVVRFMGDDNQGFVQLGFEEELLELVETVIDNWEDEI